MKYSFQNVEKIISTTPTLARGLKTTLNTLNGRPQIKNTYSKTSDGIYAGIWYETKIKCMEDTEIVFRSNMSRHNNNYNEHTNDTNVVKSIVMDWSGTLTDPFAIAPTVAFVKTFKDYGIDISMDEAREPMGLKKDVHIAKILENKNVHDRFTKIKGFPPTQDTVQELYKMFIPTQLDCIAEYGTLIEGTANTMKNLKQEFGVKLGVTTGFNRSMSNIMLEEAIRQNFTPDSVVASDDVANGMGNRPAPFMI